MLFTVGNLQKRGGRDQGGEITLIAECYRWVKTWCAALTPVIGHCIGQDGWQKHIPSFQLGRIKGPSRIVYLIAAMGGWGFCLSVENPTASPAFD